MASARPVLARRLSQSLGGQLVLEQAEQNPFLERFYKNPRAAAFQTQLFFLFQRARQLEDVRQEDLFGAVRVADYLLEKDRLFARVTLDDAEYALYERVYERVVVDAPKPDLVVYLQAPVDVLMDRIASAAFATNSTLNALIWKSSPRRMRGSSTAMTPSPLLIVNSAAIDPVNNESDYRAAVRRNHQGAPWPAFLQSGRQQSCCQPARRFVRSGCSVLAKCPFYVLADHGGGVLRAARRARRSLRQSRARCPARRQHCAAIVRSRCGEWRCRWSSPRNSASLQANKSTSCA